jgi:TetR/AcrR family transcriptional regulator
MSAKSHPTKNRRNAQRSRAKILFAATEEFSIKGYDGARMDAIAIRADVSKNLIYHYFQSKEHLFIGVMEGIYVQMRLHHDEEKLQSIEPRQAIATLTRSLHGLFAERPEIITLLNSENLYKARHIAKSRLIGTSYKPFLNGLGQVLKKGERLGVFRKGVSPVELYITISAISYFYFSNAYTLGYIFSRNMLTPQNIKAREQHIVDVVLGYLKPRR